MATNVDVCGGHVDGAIASGRETGYHQSYNGRAIAGMYHPGGRRGSGID